MLIPWQLFFIMDSINANTLTEVTTVPTNKKLIFTDPDTNEGGIITMENLTKQVLQNLTSQQFALNAGNMTIPAALNALNSDKLSKSTLFVGNVYYSDDQVASIGGFEACLMDAINKNKIPTNGPFYGTFTAGMRHLMLGYRYDSGNYGVILLYKYDGSTIRWNINAGNITKT